MDLESLGFSKDEIEKKLLDRLVDDFTSRIDWDEEEGDFCGSGKTSFKKKMDELVLRTVEEKIDFIASTHILPRVNQMMDEIKLQHTNKWGEKKGEPVTFIEYITQRADDYLSQNVDSSGKPTEAYHSKQTMIAWLVDSYIGMSISRAVKEIVENGNTLLVGGIEKTVIQSLKAISKNIQVNVNTKVNSR